MPGIHFLSADRWWTWDLPFIFLHVLSKLCRSKTSLCPVLKIEPYKQRFLVLLTPREHLTLHLFFKASYFHIFSASESVLVLFLLERGFPCVVQVNGSFSSSFLCLRRFQLLLFSPLVSFKASKAGT